MTSTATDAPGTTEVAMTPAAKLDALRSKMKMYNLDVYLVPSDDPHLSGKHGTTGVALQLSFRC